MSSAVVEGGPTIDADNHFDSEGCEDQASIPKNFVATTVNVQPWASTELQAIIIKAERCRSDVHGRRRRHEKTLDGPLM